MFSNPGLINRGGRGPQKCQETYPPYPYHEISSKIPETYPPTPPTPILNNKSGPKRFPLKSKPNTQISLNFGLDLHEFWAARTAKHPNTPKSRLRFAYDFLAQGSQTPKHH